MSESMESGLWVKESKNGLVYWGNVKQLSASERDILRNAAETGAISLALFKKQNKVKESQPDYDIKIGPPRGGSN